MFIKNNRAFTLIEVMVSLTIITFIVSTVLFNYSLFNDRLALSAAGQEMAVIIRQAQTYGLTVKEVSVGGGEFDSAYGVYFNPTDNPSDYFVFVDTNENPSDREDFYDVGDGCGSANTECIEKLTLRSGVRISSICNPGCPATPASIRSLNVTFLRPDPDANIKFANSGGQSVGGPYLTSKVVLTSNKGGTLTVVIESTGQVSIEE